jgi:hypothetical protein
MTRNQLLPKNANLTGVMFTVETNGDISPDAVQYITGGTTIVLHKDPSLIASITHVCARQGETCKCSTLVGGVSSGDHMALGTVDTDYVINSGAPAGSYELYAMTEDGPVEDATNGTIHINS